jgi:hypothetical protein
MTSVLPYLVGVALAVTLGVLFAGVIVMARGGELNRKYGNQLMRLRIVAQAVAVALLVLMFLITRE